MINSFIPCVRCYFLYVICLFSLNSWYLIKMSILVWVWSNMNMSVRLINTLLFFDWRFLGYILNWGQMSYWGITVMINIVSIIPYCGNIIASLIWCSSEVIINRIFILHFMFGFLIGGLVILHPTILHCISSSSPLINNHSFVIPSAIFFFKDCFSYMAVFIIYSTFLFIEPDILGNTDNPIPANFTDRGYSDL